MLDEKIVGKTGSKLSPATLKLHLLLLLICGFYIIGWDLLSYHISHLNPDFEFYPLSTILLYITLFYIASGISIVALLLLYFAAYFIRNFQRKSFWRSFIADFRNQFLSFEQFYGTILIFLLIPLFFAFVGLYKQLIPIVNPFSWDQTFMHWDYVLHFHHHPWELLQPIVGYPLITNFLGQVYGYWFTMLAAILVWQAVTKERLYRSQFFLTFFVSWIILGTIMAYYFSSAGPCFYRIYANDPHDPYTPLMVYLNTSGPAWVLDLQQSLLSRLLSGSLIFGGGVSAMPSMHLSIATLCFLVCNKRNKWLGLFAFLYLILIFVAAVHLAWHYAVDGYVAMIGTLLIWYCMGKVTRRLQA